MAMDFKPFLLDENKRWCRKIVSRGLLRLFG